MELVVERVKKIVDGYSPTEGVNRLKRLRALLAAINGCRKYIEEHSQEDRGCAQRIVRELHEVLAVLPSLRSLAYDKQTVNKLHTRKLAEGQLDLMKQEIERLVKDEEAGKAELIREWIASHPVFNELKTVLANPLPKTAYVLLFRKLKDNSLELITHKAGDGRIFTRLRVQDFKDTLKLHKTYQHKPIVGAAVISEKELISVIGTVPQPDEKRDQLQALLAASSHAAGKPARDFLESNRVLNALHDLARQRKLPKESYVLLFEVAGDQGETAGEQVSGAAALDTADSTPPSDEAEPSSDETEPSTDETEPVSDETEAPSDDSEASDETESLADETETASDESSEESNQQGDDLSLAAACDAAESTPTADETETTSAESESESESSDESSASSAAPAETFPFDPSQPIRIVTKTGQEGKVISRFWPSDFAVKYKLFDSFRGKPQIVGAAVIKENELLNVFGHVPQPVENQTQLQALLGVSWAAVEKPHIEFLEQHEALKGLHDLANGDFRSRNVEAILFTASGGGIPQPFRPRPRTAARMPLAQFQNAKVVHERFASKNIVGASIISENQESDRDDRRGGFRKEGGKPGERKFGGPGGGGSGGGDRNRERGRDSRDRGGRDRDGRHRDEKPPITKAVVLAAFGRTPLKVNILLTPDTLRRLGLEDL